VKRHVVAALVLAGAMLAVAFPAGASPGDLDPTFGSAGSVNLNPPVGGPVRATGVLLQADGKVVVPVYGVRHSFAVRRYLTDGSPDTAFGTDGLATARHYWGGGPGHYATATPAGAALQPDGKIVVVGVADTPDCSPHAYTNCAFPRGWVQAFGIARFAADGSLDLGFGSPDHGFTGDSAGTVKTAFNGQSAAAKAVVIQPDGKIVAAGTVGAGNTTQIALARYNPDGALDPSFGDGGTVTTAVGPSSRASSVLLQADGKIVVAGSTADPSGGASAFALARYNPDGSLDPSLGTTGTVTTTIGTSAGASSAVLQPDGRIAAAGFARPAGKDHNRFALVRYNPDGGLDDRFGDDGVVTTSMGTSSEAKALVLQPDGTLVAAGITTKAGVPTMALILYTSKGAVGRGFGPAGKVTAKNGSAQEDAGYGLGLVLQPDGRLIAAGASIKRFHGSQGGAAVYTRITMTAPEKVTYGETIKYTMKVANTGSTDAHDVKVTFALPPGVDTPNVGMAPAGQCALIRQAPSAMGRDAVICGLGTLRAGTSAKATVRAKPLYADSTPFKSTAFVSTSDREMSPTSSTHAKASVKVTCPRHGECKLP